MRAAVPTTGLEVHRGSARQSTPNPPGPHGATERPASAADACIYSALPLFAREQVICEREKGGGGRRKREVCKIPPCSTGILDGSLQDGLNILHMSHLGGGRRMSRKRLSAMRFRAFPFIDRFTALFALVSNLSSF